MARRFQKIVFFTVATPKGYLLRLFRYRGANLFKICVYIALVNVYDRVSVAQIQGAPLLVHVLKRISVGQDHASVNVVAKAGEHGGEVDFEVHYLSKRCKMLHRLIAVDGATTRRDDRAGVGNGAIDLVFDLEKAFNSFLLDNIVQKSVFPFLYQEVGVYKTVAQLFGEQHSQRAFSA